MEADSRRLIHHVAFLVYICLLGGVDGATDPNDFEILNDFRNGLENPELLKWPANGNDACGPPSWPHVFCSNGRVTQIQVRGLGLQGPLPQNLNRLDKLQSVAFQNNKFNGKLPTFSGLSDLQFAYLDYNEFDTIPSDFFHGLDNIRVLNLDYNPFNRSTGWSIPSDLAEALQLVNFSCSGCNVGGPVPDFLGDLPSLSMLRMSYNRLTGYIPLSFSDSGLKVLWLNNQDGGGMSGPLDVIGSMVGLTQLWLHGSQFTGPIPDNIGDLTSLKELNLNRNHLVGMIPTSLANMNLQVLDLSNNMFMGPIPVFKASKVDYESNSFCQDDPGGQCASEVVALLDFLHDLNYPEKLALQWTGNDPCKGPWWGITCNPRNEVSVINLQKLGLTGTLSPSISNLSSLLEIHLKGNHIHGMIPASLTQLRFLWLLDVTGNDFMPPLPMFRNGVKVITDGNLNIISGSNKSPLPSDGNSESPSGIPSSADDQPPSSDLDGVGSASHVPVSENSTKSRLAAVVTAAAGVTFFIIIAAVIAAYCFRKRIKTKQATTNVVVPPKDSLDHDNMVKISLVDSSSPETQSGSVSANNNLGISLQVLRNVTNNFSQENELGRGGFGVVYKGELENGTRVAVKRMESGVVSSKALDEFRAEIEVLSRVSHRHLVSLLGYSIEGNERLLVYEYMPLRALSRHLFHWRSADLKPLSWAKRLVIALDVARGVEYLHTLTHQTFIHRDLKSANILLDENFRAKVSDFGLVKLAPDTEGSIATRLAGTFGYLAPEYAVTGKISTKVDVYSFGVVLMELLTGLAALDEQRPEDQRYLAEWFWRIKSEKQKLIANLDPALGAKEDIYESVYAVAELAGHCTARDPSPRPDMGYVVNVIARLVDEWKPSDEDTDEDPGIDLRQPLQQMLMGWKENDVTRYYSDSSSVGSSKGSNPAKPSGFADSFTWNDAR
ncbi:Leucine-rich repeat protein kinase family protein [Dorcoceras hygrometricum]|uniref:Leucine-rich repeat protein kinase family protein n=1 Tax=Dorcoceras hygrometricum TaxID=472368 RepID=A0A2Z7C9W9_9LAMI|nr:Leucine-rich repeat protein kinase family protein [Dorcoceras hygrometricum]